MTAHVEQLEFQAEARQLLDLLVHSVYSNKDSLSVLGTPVKVGSLVVFVFVGLISVRVWGGGPQSGSRWSARSAARTNDLEAGEDPPHTDRPWERGKDVVVQVICCLPGQNVCGRRRCACRRPALSGSTDEGPAT